MKLSDEVREQWWIALDELVDRIAALEAERDELAAELKKHCGCEFDPETAEYMVKCQTHKRVDDENVRLRAGLQMISEGDTPWLDGYHTESWEVLAEYAKQLLEPPT